MPPLPEELLVADPSLLILLRGVDEKVADFTRRGEEVQGPFRRLGAAR